MSTATLTPSPTASTPAPSTRRRARHHPSSERGLGATIVVSAISVAFGVILITVTNFLGALLRADPYFGGGETVVVIVAILTVLLVGVAVYVAAIVTANTFATIVAGRTRRIALLRLIGATAKSQRVAIAREGLVAGAAGAVIGLVGGVLAGWALQEIACRALDIDIDYGVFYATHLLPTVVVALTTWAAAWVGSRRVLTVTPLEALGNSVERGHDAIAAPRGRRASAISLFVAGAALLALGVVAGMITPLGVVISFFGGLISFTGLAIGAPIIMPPLLRLVGRLFGRSVTARLAAENALRYPERSSRMAIGVVMGVTLVTMFAVATESVKVLLTAASGGYMPPEVSTVLDTFGAVMMGLVAVSAVIAAVGLVNLLTIGIVQRRREFGLLRALGLTTRQIRGVVLMEAAHITITALLFGLVLGIAYGWVAAQSVLGSVTIPPSSEAPTFVLPAIGIIPVLVVICATAVLTAVAAVVPTRLATRVTPVEALAE